MRRRGGGQTRYAERPQGADHLTEELRGKALAALRTAQLGFDYKATLTPTNRMWTLPTLLEELQRERAQIEAQGRKP